MKKLINLIKINTYDSSKDKIIINKDNIKNQTNDIALGVLVIIRQDFDIENIDNKIIGENDSFQIRPKSLYKSNRGIFYKEGKERRYLSTQEQIDLKIKNPELAQYLVMSI